VDPVELAVLATLVVVLVVVAVYYAWQQRHTAQQLRNDTELSLEDRRYLHRRIVRRMLSSALLLVLAALLAGWYFVEPQLVALAPAEENAPLPESSKQSLEMITFYVIIALMVFLFWCWLTVFDMIATARYGDRHRRQLVEDRRTALQEEVERIRRGRSELN
jgi:hypothetical protein